MNEFFNIEIDYLTILTFLFVIVVSLIILIVRGDTGEKNFQKIIGGLSIFIIAILIKNVWIVFTSLFIGGLIIASEQFLKSLAAILRTNSDGIPGTLAALKDEVNFKIASEDEISKEVDDQDVLEVIDIDRRLSLEKRKGFETQIINILQEKYTNYFTPKVKVDNQYGKIIVDGVIHLPKDSQSLDLDNILGLAEIKYVHNSERHFIFELLTRRILEKIRYFYISKQVLVIFYSKKLTLEMVESLENRLSGIYNPSEEKKVVFGFININETEELDVIKLPPLQKLKLFN